jgi:2-polyprenyl-3-methyl-5-hydroxy-6-metoxy-1,4-benzoquinol methylase
VEFQLHTLEWSDEKVARFWNNIGRRGVARYFAEQVGTEVLALAASHISVTGNVMDFGCGKGALIGKLLGRGGVRVTACDTSPASIEHVNVTYRSHPDFVQCVALQGLPLDLPAGQFDCIFLLETLEHLSNAYLEPTIREVWRLLKPGGAVVVTTPNDEDLGASEVLCPECGAIFHRMQHVRSFSKDSMGELFGGLGFQEVFCQTTNLTDQKKDVVYHLAQFVRKALRRDSPPKGNLIFIGRKR